MNRIANPVGKYKAVLLQNQKTKQVFITSEEEYSTYLGTDYTKEKDIAILEQEDIKSVFLKEYPVIGGTNLPLQQQYIPLCLSHPPEDNQLIAELWKLTFANTNIEPKYFFSDEQQNRNALEKARQKLPQSRMEQILFDSTIQKNRGFLAGEKVSNLVIVEAHGLVTDLNLQARIQESEYELIPIKPFSITDFVNRKKKKNHGLNFTI